MNKRKKKWVLDSFILFCFLIILELEFKDLALDRKALYHLNHASSPFCSSCFPSRVSHLCPG
jgi:hypothetical protein